MKNRKKHRSGQVLLITIMLIAVVLTVVLTVSFTSRTETQLTKLEEENQKALAAAEAGIEAALKSGIPGAPIAINSLAGLDSFSGEASVTSTVSTTFVSPLVLKNQQFTFYLADYSNGSFSNPYNGNIVIYYGKSDTECTTAALEITVVQGNGPNYDLQRVVSDGDNLLGAGSGQYNGTTNKKIDGVDFYCKTTGITISPSDQPKFMLVRALFADTKVGFDGESNNLRSQGRYITSTATTTIGVTKKVQLFQSHPQIPADFFITSF